uniref:(northern house mosquito) hypothetical protein n=1 Tax=Culex pipiens TaxID=7175 RepID=A0A8D8AL04_CULPI
MVRDSYGERSPGATSCTSAATGASKGCGRCCSCCSLAGCSSTNSIVLDSDDESTAVPLTVLTGRVAANAAAASGCTSMASSSPAPVLLLIVTVRDDGDSEETVVGDDDDDEGEISTSVNSSSSSAPPPPPTAPVPLDDDAVSTAAAAVLVSLVGSILIFYLLVYRVCVSMSVLFSCPISTFFSLSFCSFTERTPPAFLPLMSNFGCAVYLFILLGRSVFFLDLLLLDQTDARLLFSTAREPTSSAVFCYPSGNSHQTINSSSEIHMQVYFFILLSHFSRWRCRLHFASPHTLPFLHYRLSLFCAPRTITAIA